MQKCVNLVDLEKSRCKMSATVFFLRTTTICKIGFDTAESDSSKVSYKGFTPYIYSTWIPSSQPRFAARRRCTRSQARARRPARWSAGRCWPASELTSDIAATGTRIGAAPFRAEPSRHLRFLAHLRLSFSRGASLRSSSAERIRRFS